MAAKHLPQHVIAGLETLDHRLGHTLVYKRRVLWRQVQQVVVLHLQVLQGIVGKDCSPPPLRVDPPATENSAQTLESQRREIRLDLRI